MSMPHMIGTRNSARVSATSSLPPSMRRWPPSLHSPRLNQLSTAVRVDSYWNASLTAFTTGSRATSLSSLPVCTRPEIPRCGVRGLMANYTLHPSSGIGLGADFVRTLARRG